MEKHSKIRPILLLLSVECMSKTYCDTLTVQYSYCPFWCTFSLYFLDNGEWHPLQNRFPACGKTWISTDSTITTITPGLTPGVLNEPVAYTSFFVGAKPYNKYCMRTWSPSWSSWWWWRRKLIWVHPHVNSLTVSWQYSYYFIVLNGNVNENDKLKNEKEH